MVLTRVAGLVVAGLAAGIRLALGSRTLASSVLAQLRVEGAMSIAVASAGIVAGALLSSLLPALRTSRVEPAQALRRD